MCFNIYATLFFILFLFKVFKQMGQCQSAQKKEQPFIQEVYESKKSGFSPIYRKSGTFQLQYTPVPNINSVTQLLIYCFDKHPNKPTIGYVKVEKVRDQQGQQIQNRTISNLTGSQIKDMSLKLSQSIMNRKFGFTQPVHKMDLIGIYSKNRFQWLLTDIACIFQGITTIPLYDTLGIQNLSYCLKQTQLTSLFVSADTLKTLLTLKDFGNLRNIISFDPLDEETVKKLAQLKMNLVYFKDLLQQGATIKPNTYPIAKPSLESCLTFSYTSGTTGPPKGAMLSHRNFLAFIRVIAQHPDIGIKQDDVYASYLPLPHVMQRAVYLAMIGLGGIVICTSGDVLKLKEDCQVIKPTLFISVPRIYNRIVQAVKAKFQAQTGFKKWLIEKGVNSKLQQIQSSGDRCSTFYDSLIFSKVRQSFGGRIRVLASGSAPMNPQSRTFIQILMSCPLLEGYGSTQTTAAGLYTLASTPGDYSFLCDALQVKLSSIPQMNYTAEDVDANGANSPRGEIWFRGHSIFMGYYKLQQITKETITSDGWLKTGDVGQYFPHSKSFKIIDRKKNIFKLQQGEYIAPDKVENVYLKSSLLAEVFIHGQSTENFILLIAVPNKDALLQFAKSKNIEGSYETVTKDKKLRSMVLAELNKMAKAEGLNSLQQAKNIYFQLQNFTARQIVTNTAKLIRFQAKKYYKAQIQSMYKEGDILGSDKK